MRRLLLAGLPFLGALKSALGRQAGSPDLGLGPPIGRILAGAAGYVLKRCTGDELIQAIRTVAKGGLYFDATLANRALAGQRAPSTAKGEPHAANLSEREKDVLIQLAWGYSNKEIAVKLRISVKTVETYKVRIGEKLGLRSRSEIVQYAMRQGWMNETSPLTRIAK